MAKVRSNLGDITGDDLRLCQPAVRESGTQAMRIGTKDFTGGCDGDNDDVVWKEADCHLQACVHGEMKNVKIMLMVKQCGGGTERHTSEQSGKNYRCIHSRYQ